MTKLSTTLKLITVSTSLIGTSFACSNIFVAGPDGVAAVARSMDLEMNTGDQFAYGKVGQSNTSNINIPQKAPIHALKWKNKYAFLGQSGFGTYTLTDGINTAGVYAAYLDLPNVSFYPEYNPKDSRPELAITDAVNYVLGTTDSVPQAISALQKTQMIQGALELKTNTGTLYGDSPVHLVLRDKHGNNAVIEWTKSKSGQLQTDYYVHLRPQRFVTETIYQGNKKIKTVKFNRTIGSAVTNAPAYSWQLKNANKYNYVFTGATNAKWDGQYMNGSGMHGIPGDWTPPSRFVRGDQLVRLMPKPKTERQALFLALEAWMPMLVPVGSNPAATEWASLSDLQNNVYYYWNMYTPAMLNQGKTISVKVNPVHNYWQAYDLKSFAKDNNWPNGWISAVVKPQTIVPKGKLKQLRAMMSSVTPGETKTQIVFAH